MTVEDRPRCLLPQPTADRAMTGCAHELLAVPMNLWLRLLHLLATSWARPRLVPPFDSSMLNFRVWFLDLDTSLHMNNGRYWTLMDLGRTDLILRSGLWRAVLRHGWTPVVSAATIRFRREMKLFRAFRLETHILCWAETWLVMEHRIISKGANGRDIISAIALVRVGLYDRKLRGFVPVQRMFDEMGTSAAVSPEPSPEVGAFLASEEAMKGAAVRQ
jgi:acyl-CoA thioesterase FadM